MQWRCKNHTQKHVTIFHVGKHKRYFAKPYKQLRVTQAQWTLHSSFKVITSVARRTGCAGCTIWNSKKPTHTLANNSERVVLWITCFGLYWYIFNIRNTLPSPKYSYWENLYTYIYIYTNIYIHIFLYIAIYTHTYIHAYIHTHIHI